MQKYACISLGQKKNVSCGTVNQIKWLIIFLLYYNIILYIVPSVLHETIKTTQHIQMPF